MSLSIEWIEEIVRVIGSKYEPTNLVDVGANIGVVAQQMVHYFPKSHIFCFEPCKTSFCNLAKTFEKLERVSCFPVALSDFIGTAELHKYNNDLCNTLIPGLSEPWLESVESETVEVITLDQFVKDRNLNRIDVLKIDVEGNELSVLRGAMELLSTHRILFIYAEVGFHRNRRHQCFTDLLDFLVSLNYDLCGFYETFKDGKKQQYTVFCNALFMIRPRNLSKDVQKDA